MTDENTIIALALLDALSWQAHQIEEFGNYRNVKQEAETRISAYRELQKIYSIPPYSGPSRGSGLAERITYPMFYLTDEMKRKRDA